MAVSALVCLDKDGTLLENVPYNVDPDRISLAPGATDALALLSAAGFRVAVVSNQPGVERGVFDSAALDGVADRIRELSAAAGGRVDGIYFCPHDGGCDCRKPQPGLVLRALRDLEADARRSWMVGDILDDVEAGARAGLRTILIDNGGETEWRSGRWRTPDWRVARLDDAARVIVEAAA